MTRHFGFLFVCETCKLSLFFFVWTLQLLSENHVMPALLYYVKRNQNPGFPDWSATQYEELQLHAIAVLASVAPVLVDKYLSCRANTLLLVFLEWCIGQGQWILMAFTHRQPQTVQLNLLSLTGKENVKLMMLE